MACEICYHYPAYKLEDVLVMDEDTFDTLYGSLDVIAAKKMISDYTVSMYPHVKQKDRTKIHNNTTRIAFPKQFRKRIVTSDQLAMNGVKIGNIQDHIKGKNGK